MSTVKVEVFLPDIDVNGNFVDPSHLISQMQPFAVNNLTMLFESVTMFNQTTEAAQGSIFVWAIDQTNAAAAQTTYDTYIATVEWPTPPHFLATTLTAMG